jgi:hypothetical protein
LKLESPGRFGESKSGLIQAQPCHLDGASEWDGNRAALSQTDRFSAPGSFASDFDIE